MTKIEKQVRWEHLHECPLCGSDECENLIYDIWGHLAGCDKCCQFKNIDEYAAEHFEEYAK